MLDNEFLDSEVTPPSEKGLETAILALARSINNLAIALDDDDEEDENYFIKDV